MHYAHTCGTYYILATAYVYRYVCVRVHLNLVLVLVPSN